MRKHTPGPWETNGDPYVFCGNRSIAFCDTRHGGEEDKANARLIAAAPELLGIVERLVEHGLSTSRIREAIAVIAKATRG